MRGYVTDAQGACWLLPEAAAWQLEYTAGVPCDSFWIRCPWGRENTASPAGWVSFTAYEEGEFVGEDAYTQFGQLANVFYDSGPGLLVHPLWQAANAYFVSLRLEQEPRPDYVRYSFSFWEDDSWYTGLAVQVTQEAAQEGAQSGGSAPLYHRVVKGDTLWAIANTYGVGLSELIALNPQIKNPNLIRVGDEVRVR